MFVINKNKIYIWDWTKKKDSCLFNRIFEGWVFVIQFHGVLVGTKDGITRDENNDPIKKQEKRICIHVVEIKKIKIIKQNR